MAGPPYTDFSCHPPLSLEPCYRLARRGEELVFLPGLPPRPLPSAVMAVPFSPMVVVPKPPSVQPALPHPHAGPQWGRCISKHAVTCSNYIPGAIVFCMCVYLCRNAGINVANIARKINFSLCGKPFASWSDKTWTLTKMRQKYEVEISIHTLFIEIICLQRISYKTTRCISLQCR